MISVNIHTMIWLFPNAFMAYDIEAHYARP